MPHLALCLHFFNPVFQVSTAKNEINLFNNHILIVAPVTFAPAGAMTPSAEFLFYSAAYLCLQQESMSVSALFRLLEVVTKSIKHATAMSTILAIELFQARRDAAIASSKRLLDNSNHELRNAPINSQQ